MKESKKKKEKKIIFKPQSVRATTLILADLIFILHRINMLQHTQVIYSD